MNREKFINFFTKRRKKLGLSQNNIAEELGISVQAVSNWERLISFPDISYLSDIAKILETDVQSLVNGVEKKVKLKENIGFDIERFSSYLSKLRKTKNLTQGELGKILNVSGQNISRFENGGFLPSIELIEKYANYFNVSFLNVYYGLDNEELFENIISENHGIKKTFNLYKILIPIILLVILIPTIILIPILMNNDGNEDDNKDDNKDLIHTVVIVIDEKNTLSYEIKNNETVVLPEIPEKRGYTGRWNNLDTVIRKDTVFSIIYTPNSYTITYHFADSGIEDYVQVVTYGEEFGIYYPNEIQNLVYILNEEEFISGIYNYDHDIEVQGIISNPPQRYTITFDSNGGSFVPSITNYEGAQISKPNNPVKAGYKFAGWSIDIPSTMPPYNLEIEAIWVYYNVCYINFNGENDILYDREYGINNDFFIPTPTSSSDSLFIDWYDNPDCSGEPITEIDITKSYIDLYAKWVKPDIIVDATLIDININDEIVYNNSTYIYGVNLFKTINEALSNALEGDYIYVSAGTYDEDITISLSNISFFGPNADSSRNRIKRSEEAIITGVITLKSTVKNVSFNGFKFIGDSQITVNDSENNLIVSNNQNIVFEANHIDKGTSTTPIINLCSDNSTYNVIIQHCNFKSGLNEDMISLHNTSNLTVTFSDFENINNNAISIYDNEGSKGLSGNLKVKSNIFKNINGSALKVYYTDFNLSYNEASISIINNHFKSVYGDTCIDFVRGGENNTPSSFILEYNAFEDVYRMFKTAVNGAKFTKNKVYKYDGELSDSYIIYGSLSESGAPAYIDCERNLYISMLNGKAVFYLKPSENGFIFNEYVSGADEKNLDSFTSYKDV